MKHTRLTAMLVLVTLGAATLTQAHDPKEHAKDAESPDCAAMHTTDHSKMPMNDPVMQAMMKQCMDAMHDKHQAHAMTHDDASKHDEHNSTTQHSEHHH